MTPQKISIWHKATEKQPEQNGKWIPIVYKERYFYAIYNGCYEPNYEHGRPNDFFYVPTLCENIHRENFDKIEWAEQTTGMVLTEGERKELLTYVGTINTFLPEILKNK